MAMKSQGALLSIETARASAKVISGITGANPAVVSSTAHGYANGDIVVLKDVVGMVQLNNRAFVVAGQTTDSYQLKGVNSTNYTAYASGGNAYKITRTAVGEVRDFNSPGAASDETDTTHLQSLKKEKLLGLANDGDATFSIWTASSDAGQAAVEDGDETKAELAYTLYRSDGKTSCFVAMVKQQGFNIATNGAVEGSVTLTYSAARTRFA